MGKNSQIVPESSRNGDSATVNRTWAIALAVHFPIAHYAEKRGATGLAGIRLMLQLPMVDPIARSRIWSREFTAKIAESVAPREGRNRNNVAAP